MDKVSAKLIISVVSVFVLLVGVAAGTSLVRRVQQFRSEADVPTPSLSVSPYQQTKAPNSTFTFDIMLNTGTESIAGIDIALEYAPSAIQLTSVQRGTGISSLETELINNIDNTNGRLTYTVITQNLANAVSGSSLQVIRVNGVITSQAAEQNYSLRFVSGTNLSDVDGNQALASVVNGILTVSTTAPTSTPVPSPTGGGTLPTPTTGTTLPTPTTGAVSIPANYMAIVPETQSVSPGDSFTFSVNMNTGTDSIAGTDVYLNFDPADIQITSVEQGSGISGMTEFINTYNNSNGTISYTAAHLSGSVQGSNLQVIVVNGRVNSNATGLATISFTPDTIMGDTSGANVLAGTRPGTINIATTPTATNTPIPTSTSALPSPTGPVDPADSILYIDPSTLTVNNGSTFNLNLILDSGVNSVVGTEVYITFNPSVLQAVDVIPGTYFPNYVETLEVIDNTNGTISYVLHIPPQDAAVRDVDVLATLVFQAVSEGSSSITITADSIVGAVNTGGTNALRSRSGATITVIAPSLLGDINDINGQCGDGRVDILDYVILFENFGESPTDHPCADINGDGTVNILDYVLLFENFGRTL